jgi:hypothetical protein
LQTCPVCQIANPLAATVCRSCRGSLVPDVVKTSALLNRPTPRGLALKVSGLIGLCLAAVLVWWSGVMPGTGNAPELASAAEVSRFASPESLPVRVDAVLTLSGTATPSLDGVVAAAEPTASSAQGNAASEQAHAKRQAAAQVRREQSARDRAAAEEQMRVARAREQQRVDEAARQQAAAEAAQQARVVRTAPPPVPVLKTVEQNCASSSNFFSREVCRLRTCGDTAFAEDPVCLRFREIEEANRRAVTN